MAASISIIIATAGRPTALKETLGSLARVRVPAGWSVEVILVENGVVSGAKELLQGMVAHGFASVRYLFHPLPGKSRALNAAIREASGDVLLFTDDDVRFPVDWVERMCSPITAGHADAVAGGVRLAPHLMRPWMNHTHRAWLASTADYLSPDEPSEMCGANMAVSRRVFDKVGGFDPNLGPGITGGGEESLISWQIKDAGFRLVGALDVQVEHHLNPDRLRYRHWIRAAHLRGAACAYHLHHWFHKPLAYPWIQKSYILAKLSLRRWCAGRKDPNDEGISPWELSYLAEIATCDHFMRERHRPRNYPRRDLRKRAAEQNPLAA